MAWHQQQQQQQWLQRQQWPSIQPQPAPSFLVTLKKLIAGRSFNVFFTLFLPPIYLCYFSSLLLLLSFVFTVQFDLFLCLEMKTFLSARGGRIWKFNASVIDLLRLGGARWDSWKFDSISIWNVIIIITQEVFRAQLCFYLCPWESKSRCLCSSGATQA